VEDIRRMIKSGARIDSQRGVSIGGRGGWRERRREERKNERKKEGRRRKGEKSRVGLGKEGREIESFVI